MKRLPLIITAAILVLIIGGYFLYSSLFEKGSAEPWSLVPESSVLVYESEICKACTEKVKESAVWKIIERASFYTKQSDSLTSIFDFLTESHYNLISLHVTKKDDFDFVFYTKAKGKNFDIILDQWKKNKQFKFSQREFNSVKIQEVLNGNQVFSWVFLDDIWVGSFTPFLIEDVIRTYESGNTKTFKNSAVGMSLPKMKNDDAGNLYINLTNFSEWLQVFTDGKSSGLIQDICESAVLDIKLTENNLVLNGLSSDSTSKSKFILSIFENQSPVPFNLKNRISNRTVILTSYGISDGEGFRKNLESTRTRKPELKDTLLQITKSLPIDLDKFYRNINGEIGLCQVESKGESMSKVLLIDTHQAKEWIDVFNVLSEKLSVDTIFFEKYSDYEIRELPLYRFPEKIFGPLVSGFDRSYYTSIGNTIFIGDDLDELKRYLEDIDREDTWGKSVHQNKFLETTLLESSISVYLNTSKIWNILAGRTNPKWKKFLSENSKLLQSLGMGAIQFSHLNESFYTNITLACKAPGKEIEIKGNSRKIITNLENAVAKMFVVKNHADKRDEVLVQDSLNNLQLISSDGKMLWTVQLDGLIKGDVEQIDFYNNGKLQFLFTTNTKLHILDRLGNYVSPFPVAVPAKDLEYVSAIDYDHSRKYRFLLAGKSGALWMYDKEGKNLEGWKPKNLEGSLAVAPRHHRIRGKDYIVAIRKDGNVFLLNRRGETAKNFPLNLAGRPSGEYFIESGNSIATTYFVVVTKDGFRVKFNLEGKIQSRETLLKSSGEAQFALIPERNNKSYIISRQELKQLVLLDESGKEILKNEYVGLNPLDIQYINYGAGITLITVTDILQNLAFVYDEKGNLLTTPPIESYILRARLSDDDKPKIYSVYQKSLTIQVLP